MMMVMTVIVGVVVVRVSHSDQKPLWWLMPVCVLL
jgi:hypothetical protein